MKADTVIRWGALWRDKESEHFLFENRIPMLFRTRREARAYIDERYGYIRQRKDLRQAPHFWRIPIALMVRVEIAAASPESKA